MGFKKMRAASKLKAITALAKKIHKEHPNKKYVTCQKEAAKKLK